MKLRANAVYGSLERNPVTTALVSAGAAAILSVFLTIALGLYSQATYVTKTACNRNPSGAECAKLRQEVARAEPIENPCISHQRVEGTKGRNCPRFYIAQHRGDRSRSTVPDAGSVPSWPTGRSADTLSPAAGDEHGSNQIVDEVGVSGPRRGEGHSGNNTAPAKPEPPAAPPTTTAPAQDPGPASESPLASPAATAETHPIREGAGALLEEVGALGSEALQVVPQLGR